MDLMIIVNKMGTLMLMMLAGIACAKLGVTGPEFNKYANKAVMNLFLVATMLNTAGGDVPDLSARQMLVFVFWMMVSLAVFFVLGCLASKLMKIPKEDTSVAVMLTVFSNNIYLGLPIAQSAMGTEAALYVVLSAIPVNLIFYTAGMAWLRGGKSGFRLRDLLTPPTLSLFAALILIAFHIRLPAMVSDVVSTLSAATIPLAMIIIGTSLGQIPLKTALGDWRAFVLTFVRLILCPLAFWLIMDPFVPRGVVRGVLIILSTCPSAVMITNLCIDAGRDDALCSKTIFISSLLSAVTIPVMLHLLY